jgi:hypothetical protein
MEWEEQERDQKYEATAAATGPPAAVAAPITWYNMLKEDMEMG